MSRQDRFSWFAAQSRRNRSTRAARNPRLRRLHVEPLEDRRMLAVITVDSLLDNFDPGAPASDGVITLREAIVAANTDAVAGDAPAGSGADTIDFSVSGTINLTFGEFGITNDLTINGPGASQLTIDAGGSSRIFDIDDGSNFSNDVVAISGLTLTGGNATGDGGAIRSREGLTLSNLVVTGSTASGNGGGIDAFSGSNIAGTFTTSIIDTVVSNNSTIGNDAEGGGIFVITSGGSTTNISGSTISGNDTSGSNAEGGGIFVLNFATTNISLSTISGNSSTGASSEGGGIYVDTRNSGVTTISNTTISGNSTDGSSADGGGIYVTTDSGGMTTITGSTVSGNSTTSNADGGGIFVFDEGTTTITGSTITLNNGSGDGGGIAISTSSGNTTVEHSTIAFNTADPVFLIGNGGGGLFVSVGTLTLDHSILAENTDNSGDAPEIFGAVGASFSLISDDTGATITDNGGNQIGTSGSPIDPMLGPLTIFNGGPTETFALLPSSPAVDAGDPGIVSPPANDQRGAPFARVIDDPVAPGSGIDLGAFERQTLAPAVFPLVVDSVFDNDNGNYAAGDLSLREAIELANGNSGADTIIFDASLTGATIQLTLGELQIVDSVTINGLGPNNLTIDANNLSRIFDIDDGNNANHLAVDISGLTLTGGNTSASGGAVRSLESLTLADSVISGNSALVRGGGIYARAFNGSTTTITDSKITGSSIYANYGIGGGIFTQTENGGTTNISRTSISGNTVDGRYDAGGGVFAWTYAGGSTTISGSTISDNRSYSPYSTGGYGGGINAFGAGMTTITNSTISGNTAKKEGGGIYASTYSGGTIEIVHSTVSGNFSAYSGAGGIRTVGSGVSLDHAIVAGNSGTTTDILGMVGASYSLIGDNTGATITDNGGNQIGTSGAPIDPLLGPLTTSNGGPTETFALLPSSPAIDTGDSGFVAPPANDQRGPPFLRVADGGVNGVRIDIGAYERQTVVGLSPLVVDTAADENDGDYSIGDLSLREAVGLANGNLGADTISFDAILTGATILLTLGELQIVDSVTINGLGANNLTIDANNLSRIFNFDDGDSGNQLAVAVDGLTLTQGDVSFPDNGGAIRSVENLSVTNSTISNSQAPNGGGLYSSGNLSVVGSTISGNTAGDGGGIYIKLVAGGTAMIQDSTISGNYAFGDGGGVSIRADAGAAVTISGSTLTGNYGDNGGGVFARSTGGATTTIQSSTISGNRGGDFGLNSQSYFGGGISASTVGGATTTIQNSIISYNNGLRGGGLYLFSHNGGATDLIDSDVVYNGHDYGYSSKGGGIYARVSTGSTMSITGTSVRRNIAYTYYGDDSSGGGIYLENLGTATITGSTIHENRATGDTAKGGGIFTITGGNTTIANSSIRSNDVNYYGGPVYGYSYGGGLYAETFSGGTLTITGVTISDNIVEGEVVAGGGISLGFFSGPAITNTGETIISGSTIQRNNLYSLAASSTGGGAGIHANTNGSGTTTITGTTISENQSEIDGGGLLLQGTGTSTITGSTISGNQASYFGAGARIGDATNVTIAHSTITGNRADLGSAGEVGGIFVTSSSVSLDHSIVAGNTETIANAPDIGGSVTARFSIIGDDTGATITDNGGNQIGTSGSPIDPLLGSLTDHGGLTKTHRLLTGSPAIDMGDAAFVGPPDSDQRGAVFDRVADGDGDATPRIDIGAYEIQALVPQTFVVDTLVDEFDADMTSGDFSLREALELANGTPGLADTIAFAPGLAGTIALVLGQLKITDDVTVTGPGADRITIDAQQQSRVLNIDDGDDTNHQSVEISGLTFTRGQTRFPIDLPFVAGGAIHSRESLTLNNSVISDSNADISLGGGLYLRLFSGAAAAITGTTISGNTVESSNGRGGGISVYAQSGTTTSITGSTISGNQSDGSGGGIHAFGAGTVTISHSTITGNTADADSNGTGFGGGIRGTLTLDHTIVAGNVDNTGVAPDISGTFAATYSLIGDDTGATITDNGGNQIGTGGAPIDPLLGPLVDNGGLTKTHALLAGSPAIDTGDINALPSAGAVPLFDQRGNNFGRVQNGRIDIGAFEVRDTLSADFDSSSLVAGADFLAWQRGFGTMAPGAAKTDGDADNDLDVDGSDLGVWQSQFGAPAPLAGELSAVSTEYFEPGLSASNSLRAAPSSLEAQLIDAAIAVAATELSSVRIDDAVVADDPVLLDFHSRVPFRSDDAGPRFDILPFAESSESRDSDTDGTDEAILSNDVIDALLADVF